MDQLGFQVDHAVSTRIITTNRATKTSIALVDNGWLFKTNVMLDWITQELQLSQNRQHTCVPAMYGHFKITHTLAPLIELKIVTRNFLPWDLGSCSMKTTEYKPTITANHVTENGMTTQSNKTSETTNHVLLVESSYSIKEYGMTFLVKKEHATYYVNTQSSLVTG
ncbi:hypothetical protein G9A89_006496 [Geosiphon pyriformis]|nr:hypothetical protein G9A89_006496 [Geosiphon pyriformis]